LSSVTAVRTCSKLVNASEFKFGVLLKITLFIALMGQLTGHCFKIFSRVCELVEDRVHGHSFVNTANVAFTRSKQGVSVSVE
jgi:hypothetical protein